MRTGKLVLGAVVIAAVLAGRCHSLHPHSALGRATRRRRRRRPHRRRPCPFRWRRSSRRRSRSTSNIRRARRRSATSRCRPRSPAICEEQLAPGRRRREGKAISSTGSIRRDFEAALDQANAQVRARRGLARLCCAPISTAATKLAKSGYLAKDSFDQRTSAVRQAEAALAMDRAAVRTARAQPRAHRNPRALRRAARAQPGAGRHAGQRRRHRAEHARAARSDLRHLQSERDGPGGDPEGARSRQGRGRGPRARRDGTAPQGRAHLHRQRGRPHHRHDRGARDHRQRRSRAAARPVCPHPPARSATSRIC